MLPERARMLVQSKVSMHVETVVLLSDKKVDGHVDIDLDVEKLEGKSGTATYKEIKDVDGNNMVMINDIIFKGRQAINWEDVEKYLMQYVGEFNTIADNNEVVYIGADHPDEYTH